MRVRMIIISQFRLLFIGNHSECMWFLGQSGTFIIDYIYGSWFCDLRTQTPIEIKLMFI